MQPFSEVSSTVSFKKFMTETIPYTIFSNDRKARLEFSYQNPPLGELSIRVQHWKKTQCGFSPIVSPAKSDSCNIEHAEETDQMTDTIMTPKGKMDWRSAE